MVQVRKLGLVFRDLKIFANPVVEFLTALIVNTAYRFNFRWLTHFLSGSLKCGRLVETPRFVCLDPTEHFISVSSVAWTRLWLTLLKNGNSQNCHSTLLLHSSSRYFSLSLFFKTTEPLSKIFVSSDFLSYFGANKLNTAFYGVVNFNIKRLGYLI